MGHGLKHPGDLVAWRRWHESRHPVRGVARAARARLRPAPPARVDVLTPPDGSDLLVAVEATHASVDRAVVAPLRHLPSQRTSIVCPVGWSPPDAFAGHERHTIELDQLGRLVAPTAVLAAGHYTEIGAAAHAVAEERKARFVVSQHGALTPFAPPLPRAAHLVAWTAADADFWATGRGDVTSEFAGSQLLWEAARVPEPAAGHGTQVLTYLGQGHAAEISRPRLIHAALSTCRDHGATYRPHPSERDLSSRAVLAAYQRAGITIDTRGIPLVESTAPIISVFSTGVLEAAARGLDAWVDFPRPPAWLAEFWERYAMSRLGNAPTSPPARPTIEPARRVAEILAAAS